MTRPDDRAAASTCHADPHCAHAPCFQVRLEASRPRQAHRQSNACAYHVADVIAAQRAWAAQCGLADGQLTILAIEPASSGQPREPGEPGGPADPDGAAAPCHADRPDLWGFAFSTIPLTSATPDAAAGSTAIDLTPQAGDQAAEVRRLEGLGARRVDAGQGASPASWVVMADPEGSEFCVRTVRD